MDAVRWQGNTLYLLDQTKLPVTEEWLAYTDYRKVAHAITTMVVRGAPAIGVSAAYAYCLAALEGAPMLMTRGILYTAITRAKSLFIVVGDESAVAQMVANNRQTRRYSGLRARLAGEIET